jgi:periplasmic divalent cation tolerance protein
MTADYVLVTTTTDSAEEAQRLADALVGDRLAACAHIEETDSVYWWDGAVQHDHEWRLELKTPAGRADELQAAILQTHSYDTPQVIVTPILGGSPAYLAWLTAETTPRES